MPEIKTYSVKDAENLKIDVIDDFDYDTTRDFVWGSNQITEGEISHDKLSYLVVGEGCDDEGKVLLFTDPMAFIEIRNRSGYKAKLLEALKEHLLELKTKYKSASYLWQLYNKSSDDIETSEYMLLQDFVEVMKTLGIYFEEIAISSYLFNSEEINAMTRHCEAFSEDEEDEEDEYESEDDEDEGEDDDKMAKLKSLLYKYDEARNKVKAKTTLIFVTGRLGYMDEDMIEDSIIITDDASELNENTELYGYINTADRWKISDLTYRCFLDGEDKEKFMDSLQTDEELASRLKLKAFINMIDYAEAMWIG